MIESVLMNRSNCDDQFFFSGVVVVKCGVGNGGRGCIYRLCAMCLYKPSKSLNQKRTNKQHSHRLILDAGMSMCIVGVYLSGYTYCCCCCCFVYTSV